MIFFAADFDVLSRLKDYTRTLIAWKEILSDIDNGKLNLDLFQINQAKKQRDVSEQSLQQIIREAYKWILCPVEDIVRSKPQLSWEAVAVSTSSQNLAVEIESRLKEEEWLISEWSPIHLRNLLNQWYFKDGVTEVNALKVWQDSCNYLYLPRLSNEHVYRSVIEQGLQSEDYFGFASGKEGDNFLGFAFGTAAIVGVNDSSLLIEREASVDYKERTKTPPSTQAPGQKDTITGGEASLAVGVSTPVDPPVIGVPPIATIRKQFYGNINLDPVKSKMDFAMIVDEVIQQFTTKLGVDVSISVEIQAKSSDGFDEALQRTIKENCSVLKFGSAEFEE